MRNQKYEAFLKAARTGSFKQAASELGYTQAGVSYLANALEKELGVRLFVREHGGVRLTSEGAALLPWIQEVCASERRLEAHLADLKQLEEGSLHIVAFTSTLTQWLPQITKRFTEAHPHIDLRITCCDDQAQLEHIVESGQADVGFVALPVKRPLEMELLVRDPLLVAVAPDSPFATHKRFPKKALASEPYIKLDSGEYSEMDRLFRANGVEPRVRFSIVSDYAAMGMVSTGLGYSVLSGLVLRNAPFDLVALPAEVPAYREIALAQKSSETASGAARAFIECTKGWIHEAYKSEPEALLL